ncbi:shikimate dehydrogenase [Rubrobacter taiwanensis]|jgi:shikimate dehydrogenase|uniref:Shikimate dehydrogenase (NADP(+)) n=1 Tax=Rubrobacter taiwanensis TaxID=185139 RepID=A0A4R1BHD0_9ACTN|nr:shikimate dehydrogenase [Rubrobacter taiwanensis]TCJ16686.1 shikimate dehydrogenase [Rubrobacter taiwanensis]
MFFSGRATLVGIIGHPVGHTLSPRMHNAAFAADGLDYVYVPMDVEPGQLAAAVEGLRALGFRGFNVTMPHKGAVIPLLDSLDAAAEVSGAVNTVVIEDGRMLGFNTDGAGFVDACRESGVEFGGRRVLLLGAGGAAAAIAVEVLREGAGALYIANRTRKRAEELRRVLKERRPEGGMEVLDWEEAGEVARISDVIINSTYLGMEPEDPLPVAAEVLEGKAVCDAVYLPGRETRLIQRARELGCRVVPGGLMLLYQGVRAQRMWTGREPNVEVMRRAVL